MHILTLPSFFRTRTIGDAHGLFDGSMMSSRSISFSIFCTSSLLCTGIRLVDCLTGVAFPVNIECLSLPVRPTSILDMANTSA